MCGNWSQNILTFFMHRLFLIVYNFHAVPEFNSRWPHVPRLWKGWCFPAMSVLLEKVKGQQEFWGEKMNDYCLWFWYIIELRKLAFLIPYSWKQPWLIKPVKTLISLCLRCPSIMRFNYFIFPRGIKVIFQIIKIIII